MNETYKKISTINKFFIGTVCFSLVTSQLYIATAEESIDEDTKTDSSEESIKSPITEEPAADDAVIDEDIPVAENATALVNDTAIAAQEPVAAVGADIPSVQSDQPQTIKISSTEYIPHPKLGDTSFKGGPIPITLESSLDKNPAKMPGTLADWTGPAVATLNSTYTTTLSFDFYSNWPSPSGNTYFTNRLQYDSYTPADYSNLHVEGYKITLDLTYTIKPNTITVSGVPKPVAGLAIPEFDANLTFSDDTYIADWSVDGSWSTDSSTSSTYVAGSTYSFGISIITNGTTLQDTLKGLDSAYTVSGPSAGSIANEYKYSVSYKVPAAPINSAVLDVSTAAYQDGAPSNSAFKASVSADPADSLRLPEIQDDWSGGPFVNNKFVEGNTYTKTITLTAKSGYMFGDNFALVLSPDVPTGYDLARTSAPSLDSSTGLYKTVYTLSYKVPIATKYVQNAFLESVKAPVAGELPERVDAMLSPDLTTKGEDASGAFAPIPVRGGWAGTFDKDGSFLEGKTYYFDVGITTNKYWRLASNFKIFTTVIETASLGQLSLPTSDNAKSNPLENLSGGSSLLNSSGFGAFSSNVIESIKTTRAIDGSFDCIKLSDTEGATAENEPVTYVFRISYSLPSSSSVPEAPTPPPPATTSFIAELELVDFKAPSLTSPSNEAEVRLSCDGVNDALESPVIKSKWVGKLDEYGHFQPGETYSMRLEIKTKPNWRLNDGVLFKVRTSESTSELLTPLSIDPAAGLGQYKFGSLFTAELNDMVRTYADTSQFTIKKVAGPAVDGTNAAKYIYEISYTLPARGQAIIPDDPTPTSPVIVDPTDPSNTGAPGEATEVTTSDKDIEVGTMSDTGDKALSMYAITSLSAITTSVVLIVESAYRRKKKDQQ